MLLHFINREKELKALEEAYLSKKGQLFIIYGRRRIGKTELIKQFVKDKRHFYFLARKQDLSLERDEFQKKISQKFNVFLGDNKSFESLFQAMTEKVISKEKVVVVIDEFPYWIARDETIISEFQYIWDEVLKDKNIFLILCGSYVSVMEEKVLSRQSPLYGRRTGQLKIDPLAIKYVANFLPTYGIEDLIKMYGAVGTIPFYLKEMNTSLTFLENIEKTFLNKANILHQEAEFLLKEELRETNVYFNILKSIIDGATKVSEIASLSRVDITNINKYLSTLIHLKLIRRIKPILSSSKEKRYLYQLEDNYFRFWLTFVYPYQSEIEENSKSVLKLIQKRHTSYSGPVFETFCQMIFSVLPVDINKLGLEVGRWWYKDKEIDIVALNRETKEILFGECKWQENVDAFAVLRKLDETVKEIGLSMKTEYYAVFAKSFSKKIDYFLNKKVYCFDIKDIETALRS